MGNVQTNQQSTLPYNVGEQSQIVNLIWNLHDAIRKSDQKKFSLFSFDKKKNPTYIPLAQNCLRRLKTIKHPNIITYVDGLETEDQISIITEPITTLNSNLPKLEEFPKAISYGIHQVTTAIIFLNSSGFVHGNLKIDSIFVTPGGDWKLGGLELTCKLTEDLSILRNHFKVIGEKYIPPELTSGNFNDVLQNNKSNYDCWLLGCFLVNVFSGDFQGAQSTRVLKNIPKELTNEYKGLVGPPNTRAFDYFLNSPYFRNSFIQTCLFLENISVKDTNEKDNFFKNLPSLLEEIPENFQKYKILPELVKALDYGGGNFRVLNPILEIASKLTPEEYQASIVPSLAKWFSSQDKSLRLNLLKNISNFSEHLNADLINTQIFPSVERSFRDENPNMREVAVRCVVYLVPKLDKETVKTNLLQHFSKLQVDQKPGIRTNTTICLGKISPYLSQDVRERVLAPAFARALKDIFPPTRSAGLQAIQATIESYPPDQIVSKLFPSVVRLTIDPIFDIRVAAFKTVNLLVNRLDQHHLKMGTSNEDPKQNEPNLSTPQGVLESFGGWATNAINNTLSNVTNKITSMGDKNTPPSLNTSTSSSFNSSNTGFVNNSNNNSYNSTNNNTSSSKNVNTSNNSTSSSSSSSSSNTTKNNGKPSNHSSGNTTNYKPPQTNKTSNDKSGNGNGSDDEFDDWDNDDDWGNDKGDWDSYDSKNSKNNTTNTSNNKNVSNQTLSNNTLSSNTSNKGGDSLKLSHSTSPNTSNNNFNTTNNFTVNLPPNKTTKTGVSPKKTKPKKEKPVKLSQLGNVSSTKDKTQEDFGDGWEWSENDNKKSTNTNTNTSITNTQPKKTLGSMTNNNTPNYNINFNTLNNNNVNLLQPMQPMQPIQPMQPNNNKNTPSRPTFVPLETPNDGFSGLLAPSNTSNNKPIQTAQPTSLDFLFSDNNTQDDEDEDGWGDFNFDKKK
eukprot:TRINITY_DN4272_c0_g3_i3.p1 TRINITY_DN4272_c0_g3~~TRINITY_DN4272_c0_g3_i3.p1  ORF type:complete len:952 (-),score=298.91 TRINITY_DN4272_c0_g3_i3:33-2888(-)